MADDAEARRLQERAERIHGKNPFSPEAMAQDEHLQAERLRSGKTQRRARDLQVHYLDERMYDE